MQSFDEVGCEEKKTKGKLLQNETRTFVWNNDINDQRLTGDFCVKPFGFSHETRIFYNETDHKRLYYVRLSNFGDVKI